MNRFNAVVGRHMSLLAFLYILFIQLEACAAFNLVPTEPEASTKLHPRFDFKHFPDCSTEQLDMLRASVQEAARAVNMSLAKLLSSLTLLLTMDRFMSRANVQAMWRVSSIELHQQDTS